MVWYGNGIVTRVRGGRWGSRQGGVERRERGKLGAMGEVRIVQMGKIVKINSIAGTRFFKAFFLKQQSKHQPVFDD